VKYIVYQDGDHEYMVAFPKTIDHNRMAEALQMLRFDGPKGPRDWHRRQGEVVAAGFIQAGVCHGRSETLNIDGRGETDTMIWRSGGERAAMQEKKA
jgi:hypothetical protein